MATDTSLLAEVPFFELLSEDERLALAAQVDVVRFPAGAKVFEYGDPGDALYVIRTGQTEVYVRDDTGKRIVLEAPGPGDFFGEISLLDNGPRTAGVIAVDAVEAIRVDRHDLERLLASHPTAALRLLTATGRRLRKAAELLRHTASRNVNKEAEDTRTGVQRAADWIAEFSGSILFLLLHLAWFAAWILLNTRLGPALPLVSRVAGFDPFPFGLLTMVVSLEAIVLSVFVLLSQNRQTAKDRIRSDVEYDVNLKAELEIAHLHEKVDHMNSSVLSRLRSIEAQLAAPVTGRQGS